MVKFCTRVGYVNFQHIDDKRPLKGRGQGHVTQYKILGAQWCLSNSVS